MRLLDRLITRLLDGPLSAVITARADAAVDAAVDERVATLKLDALYRHRWHGDASRLRIHETAVVNNALFNVSGGTVTVGKDAFFGHDVAVLTGTHDIEKFGRERQMAFPRSGRDVVIGEGVWLASHVLVLGPVTIGEHAVVAGGSLVREDVAPYTVVAGRPAKVVKTIARPDAATPPDAPDPTTPQARTESP
jgi:acetyltransferase-like isoleucine patch superfamily enzyme